jgi:TPR repeat protein
MRLILPVLLSLLLSLPARAETVDETYFAATLAYKTQDYDQAFALMQAAAQAGHPGAQYWLGNMYQQGHGTPKSAETAAQWMLRAAQNDHPQAIPNLTARYETGTAGLPRDDARAFHWALKGAQMGLPPSIQDVIRYYRKGRGTTVDLAQVVHWEQIAATAGDKNSQYNMGYYYDAGYGPLQPDGAKAVT